MYNSNEYTLNYSVRNKSSTQTSQNTTLDNGTPKSVILVGALVLITFTGVTCANIYNNAKTKVEESPKYISSSVDAVKEVSVKPALGAREGTKQGLKGASAINTKEIIDGYNKILEEKYIEEQNKILQEQRLQEQLQSLAILTNSKASIELANTNTSGVHITNYDVIQQASTESITAGEGSARLKNFTQYDDIIAGAIAKHQNMTKYVLPVNLVKAIILAESGGNPNADNGSALGLMQLEYTTGNSFKQYGLNYYGEEWTLDDRADPAKNIEYGVWVLYGNLKHYNGDYLKTIQSYNYSFYSLDKLISTYGDDWIINRNQMARLNGKSSYGNPQYIEHVLKYYQ